MRLAFTFPARRECDNGDKCEGQLRKGHRSFNLWRGRAPAFWAAIQPLALASGRGVYKDHARVTTSGWPWTTAKSRWKVT